VFNQYSYFETCAFVEGHQDLFFPALARDLMSLREKKEREIKAWRFLEAQNAIQAECGVS
jgi:hypothetical protein